jgi:hypothetical protein
MAEDIAKAKQTRIDTQYYVENEQSPKTIQRDVEAARKFVLDTEKTIDTITAQQIDSIRAYLKKLKGQSP